LLNSRDQKLTFDLGSKAPSKKLRKLSLCLRRDTLRVLKLTEGLGATEAGIRVSEDVDWNELRAAATGHGIMEVDCLL
jgi:hypothetical protein